MHDGGDVLALGKREARRRTRIGSRSFYFASFALDGARREAAYALYAFFRGADDAADMPGEVATRLARVDKARASLAFAFGGKPRTELEHALAWAVRAFGIPRAPLDELLDAIEGDAGRVRMPSWRALDTYCHGVASTVGLAMAPLLGAPDHALEQAAALGRAMQLTNVLRDVAEDLTLDRIYLPADAMERAGVTEASLKTGVVDAAWTSLASDLAGQARAAYDASESGIRIIGPWRSRLAVRLMRAAYREILVEIERRGFDVFKQRVVIGTSRKVWLAARIVTGSDPAAPRAS